MRLLAAGVLLALTAGCGGAAPATVPSPSATPTPTRTVAAAPTHAHAAYVRWRLPFAIAREAVVTMPGRTGSVLLAGGMLPGDVSSAKAILIDLPVGKATVLASLVTPVHDVAGGLFAGRPAVFGGGNATEQSVVQEFTGPGWSAVAHLPTTRSDLSVVDLDGSTLVIGGYDGTNVPRQILTIGPSRGFPVIGMLKTGVRYAATAVVGSDVYIFGGEVNHHELRAVQQFDASMSRTKVVAQLPRAVGHAVAVAVGGRVLLIGGRTDPDIQTAAMWWFDPRTDRFTAAGSLPAPTSDSAVAVLGNQIWLLGGEYPQVTDRVILIRVT